MRDLRLALRNLRTRPGVSAIALITLTLGIGATTAVFTVLHAVVLAPLPYTDPERVVILNERTAQVPQLSVTRDNYNAWRDRARSFTAMGAFRPTSMTLSGAGEPERLPVTMISATLLPLLGVRIDEGRTFSDADDLPGAQGVALVSAGFAARRFAEGRLLGRVVQLDQQPYVIVGILPEGFELFQSAELYLPFGPWADTLTDDRGWHPGIYPVARLKEGVSLTQARMDMDAIARDLEQEFPDSNAGSRILVNRVQDQVVQNVRPALLMLSAAVFLVLLIACANVANLLLASAVGRQKEIALRIALGASRGRIVRQLVAESLLLSAIGGAGGLLLAWWGVTFLELTGAPAAALPRASRIGVDWTVAWFAVGLSMATGLVFGLVPALHATAVDIQGSLQEDGRGVSASRRHRRMRASLVVAEIALALVLLVGAGQALRSFDAMTSAPPGFDLANLLLVNLPLSPLGYEHHDDRTAAVERSVERIGALPGVESAAITTTLPMAGAGPSIHFNRVAQPPQSPADYVMAGYRAVTPDYLPTLRVPLLRGRGLAASDTREAPPVVVINESMARQFFPGSDPLGQRIQLGTEPSEEDPTLEVVGVVGDTKQSFQIGAKPEMFVPYGQEADEILAGIYRNTALVVRTTQDPGTIVQAVRAALGKIDPAQPLVSVRTMETAVAGSVAQPHLQMVLLIIFAVLAVALAVVGVYGVMAYAVSQRIPEIRIRMAVGASPNRVVRMVVLEGARLAGTGLALGLVASVFAARTLQQLVFKMHDLDPLTFVLAPLALGAAALAASGIPALRAARVSPFLAIHR